MPAPNAAVEARLLLACDRMHSIARPLPAGSPANLSHAPHGSRSPTPANGPALAFNGQHLERNGSYLLGHGYRAYNPQLMRFSNPDSFSPFGAGGLNAYAYCKGDPVNRRDPSGHVDENVFPGVVIGIGAVMMLMSGVSVFRSRKLSTTSLALGVGGATTAGLGVLSLFSPDAKTAFAVGGVAALLATGGVVTAARIKPGAAKKMGNAPKPTPTTQLSSATPTPTLPITPAGSRAQSSRPSVSSADNPMPSTSTSTRAAENPLASLLDVPPPANPPRIQSFLAYQSSNTRVRRQST